LTVFASDLIVGGVFDVAGGNPAGRIARWDGGSWHAMGSGVDDGVRAFAPYGDWLFVGGDFTHAGQHVCHRLAIWSPVIVTATPEEFAAETPAALNLAPNYPNPFNPRTTLSYSLPRREHVRVDVYDVRGRRVATLFNGEQDAGFYELTWEGCDDGGRVLPSGTYLARIAVGAEVRSQKMTLFK